MRRAHFLQIAFLFIASAYLTEAIAKQFEPQETTATARAFLDLGLEQYRAGRFLEAIEIFKEAIRFKPDYAEAYNNLGMAYANIDRYSEAVESLRTSIRLDPEFARAYY